MNTHSLAQYRRDIINKVIGIEGKYSNDPDDSGGETKFGITHTTASKHGYGVKSLTEEQAFQIYETDYWLPLKLDDVLIVSQSIAAELFDTGVNTGVKNSAKFLQRALNSLNNGEKHFADVSVDGDLGEQTLAAFQAYMQRRGRNGESTLFNILNSMQSMYYIDLAERRPKDEKFMQGWQSQRVSMTPEGNGHEWAPPHDWEPPRHNADIHTDPMADYTNLAQSANRAPKKRKPWYMRFLTSKINWTTMATIAVSSGVLGSSELTPEQQNAIIQTTAAIGGAGVLLLRTFLNNPE